ncbi:glutamine synthetase III [bacterium]|nr:glutamine synthetase III [bacterium]
MTDVSKYFGELVFTPKQMKKYLTPKTYSQLIKTIQERDVLDVKNASEIATAMKKWALSNGATHFTHWFQPQRSGTAEKHDAFIDYDKSGNIIETFSASQLIQSEPDASSFPSGGMRSTFEARGYTAWDPTSPVFIRDEQNGRSLIIPSLFVSWKGHPLDMKTPLNRSTRALNEHAIALQHTLGNKKAKQIKVFSGMEQEYFLVPEEIAAARLDLEVTGRTVFGAPAAKGQLMEDHYFGSIQSNVMIFMNDLDNELYRYGIPIKTKHNEVAPNQFELAPLYEEMNVAIDHNLLVMDIMRRKATEHGFKILFHEKPFEGVNGSGKHMNWSLGDNTGDNYLEPSKKPLENITFLMTLGAILLGVHKYSGLLLGAILDAGNEHRLGENEAPPAILSIYLGSHLTEILDHIEGTKAFTEKEIEHINHDLAEMPNIVKDISDRNRTSPIAFTGNKFEVRALGSSANPAGAARIFNMLAAYGYKELNERLKGKSKDLNKEALIVLKHVLKETKSVRFEGDNYSDDWKKEATKRKLFQTETTPEAIKYETHKDAIALYKDLNILTKEEVKSRVDIRFDAYSNAKLVELKIALKLLRKNVMPAVLDQLKDVAKTSAALQQANMPSSALQKEAKVLEAIYSCLQTKETYVQQFVNSLDAVEGSFEVAQELATKGKELLKSLREEVDHAETKISDEYWTLPSYDDLLLLF